MWWIILIIIAVITLAIIGLYNSLVTLRMQVQNAWSQIDVQLQRRFDLIPNFVETVKGYMTHEKETFEKIAALRTSWANATSVSEKANLDGELSKDKVAKVQNIVSREFNCEINNIHISQKTP